VAEQAVLSFGGLLRQLRVEARLTQEELAEAAGLSPRSVSDLERGIHRTARKDTAGLLADALGLDGSARELFLAAARGRGPAEDVLAARDGRTPSGARSMHGCPYRGLLPFSESDAGVFYGRERLAAELAAKLVARAVSGGLVVVTGASGSGKSSLLRAGLLPILARGQQLPRSDRWPRIVMTPTKDPLAELAARLAAVGGPDALAIRDRLAWYPDQAHLAIRSAVLAAAAHDTEPSASGDGADRLVLIVDQFEQVFTLPLEPGGEATRHAFIKALCSAVINPVGPWQEPSALVVIAVRGDFWDRCAAVPELVGALQDGQFVVGPMTDSELRLAITGPAEVAGLRIDPGLTDAILGDLRVAGGDSSAGVLPLLSQAMALTWEQREGDRLTSRGYALAGGVSHAVQTGADRVYETLPAGQQTLAREVLRSMTVARRDGGYARRPVTRDDLYTGLPGAARADIDAVLDAFAAERLTVLDEDTAQLSHDVLLQAWPRLRRWLEEDQASWILHGQLADAAAAWRNSGEEPSFLYRGGQLAALEQAVTRWSANPARSPVLTGTERGFLQASERAAARSARQRRGAVAILALLTALAVAAAGFAFSQRAAVIRQQDQVIYNQAISKALQLGTSDISLAAQLTLAAYRIHPTQDLAARLLGTENTPLSSLLAASGVEVSSVGFSPGGHTLASGDFAGMVRLWDTADPAHPRALGRPLTGGDAAVDSVAFSPDGHTLASGNYGGMIQLWDITDPAHARPLGQPQASSNVGIYSVAFSSGGHILVAGGEGGTIRFWDIADPAHPRALDSILTGGAAVDSMAFSLDGRTLASGSEDGTIRLWDVADPARPRPLSQPLISSTAGLSSVAFSPDGRTLASGNYDGTIRLWDVADPARARPLGQPLTSSVATVIDSVVFSPDGHTLASGNYDGTVQLWDVADPVRGRPLGLPLISSGAAAVDSLAFSADGHTLASGDGDGTVRLWSLPQTVLTSSIAGLSSVAFSPDGHTLAGGNYDGTVRLWDVADPARGRPLGQPLTSSGAAAVDSVAFSPDGHTLASGGDHGTVQLWDVSDRARPRPLGQPLSGGAAAVDSVAFSPDGHTLVSGGVRTVRLWDVADPVHPQPLSPIHTGDIVYSVAFTPHGHTLAGGGPNNTVELWDVADPAHPQSLGLALSGGTASVLSVALSPEGHTLVSGSVDDAVRLWDVADPARPRPHGQPVTRGTAVQSVAFSPDGHTLASGSADGTTRLWNLNVQYAIERICATVGDLTPRLWNQYIPQLRYQPSCGH
jgi:WD40 repeat protein/transcriptional regulator with XRE-family HTH domain